MTTLESIITDIGSGRIARGSTVNITPAGTASLMRDPRTIRIVEMPDVGVYRLCGVTLHGMGCHRCGAPHPQAPSCQHCGATTLGAP